MVELMFAQMPVPMSDSEVFFQDVLQLESVVKDSLLVYLAYEYKAQDAAAYLADTKLVFPMLNKEAELRGMTIKALCTLVQKKAVAYKDAVRSAELLRTELSNL
jgi:hypothetical protein